MLSLAAWDECGSGSPRKSTPSISPSSCMRLSRIWARPSASFRILRSGDEARWRSCCLCLAESSSSSCRSRTIFPSRVSVDIHLPFSAFSDFGGLHGGLSVSDNEGSDDPPSVFYPRSSLTKPVLRMPAGKGGCLGPPTAKLRDCLKGGALRLERGGSKSSKKLISRFRSTSVMLARSRMG